MLHKIVLLFLAMSTGAICQDKLIVVSLKNDTHIGVKKYDLLEFGMNIKPVVGKPLHVKYSNIKEMRVQGHTEEKNGVYHYISFGEPKEIILPNGRKRRPKKDDRDGSLMKLLYDGQVKLYEDTKIIAVKKDGKVTSKTKTQITKYLKEGNKDPISVKGKREVLAFLNMCPEVAQKIDNRFRLNELTKYLEVYNKHCVNKE